MRYTERDVSQDRAAAEEMVRRSGQTGVPVIVADSQVVVGFDRNRLEVLIAASRSARPSLGIMVADATKAGSRLGVAAIPGAVVGRVSPASPGERLGLVTGDIITEINSRPVRSADELAEMVSRLTPGEGMKVTFVRNGTKHHSEVII